MTDMGTPLDEIRAILGEIRGDIKRISERLDKLEGAPPPKPEPQEPAFLAQFVRPPVGTPRYGLGVRMAVADGAELVKRAIHCVRWTGTLALDGSSEDAAWAEIRAIQDGDPAVTKVYAEAGADPEVIATALLLGLIDPVRYDSQYFGQYVEKRRRLVGITPQTWLENEMAIAAGGAAPSGGDAPE